MTEQKIHDLDKKVSILASKMDDMPLNIVNQMRLVMIEESRKTADGLSKVDVMQGKDIETLKTNQKWIILIGGVFGTVMGKLLNWF